MTSIPKELYSLDSGEYLNKNDTLIHNLDSLFADLKSKGLFNADQLKYGFFSKDLSHKLFLLSENNKEKKEIILDYLMKNIIDKELKREDIVFMFITDKTVTTKNGEINIKERLIIRTDYYKAIGAIVINKTKNIISPNTTRIEAQKYKEIMDEIDSITGFGCFAPEFSKNKNDFAVKKRQIIASTLKGIFGENSNIVVPRVTNFDIHIRNTTSNEIIKEKEEKNVKNIINPSELKEKIFPQENDLDIFLFPMGEKIRPNELIAFKKPEGLFTKENFLSYIKASLKVNKKIRQENLDSESIENLATLILKTDLEGKNVVIKNIIKRMLDILNEKTSKGLGFYNYLINILSKNRNIPQELINKISPETRKQISEDYIKQENDVRSKKINPEDRDSIVIRIYEKHVLSPLVEAVKIYMSK